MNELIRKLMENMYIDFDGEISMEAVRAYLKEDPSREARSLLNKIVEDKGVEGMLVTLAECLKDHIRSGITEEAVRENLGTYSDSLGSRSRSRRGGPSRCSQRATRAT